MKQVTIRQQTGASYVEMAISILVFMMIIISVMELLRFSFVTVSVQHVLQEGLESATKANFTAAGGCNAPNTGIVADGLKSPSARAECIKREIINAAKSFDLTVLPTEITVSHEGLAAGTPRCGSPGINNAGARGEIVAICIRSDIQLFSWFPGTPQMDFIVFGRNEQFRYTSEVPTP